VSPDDSGGRWLESTLSGGRRLADVETASQSDREKKRYQQAEIELSPVWDTSCLAELIYDLISRQFLCGKIMSQTGDDLIKRYQWAKIESSPVWDTSWLAEQIYDLINRQFLCGEIMSQTGDDLIFATSGANKTIERSTFISDSQVQFMR